MSGSALTAWNLFGIHSLGLYPTCSLSKQTLKKKKDKDNQASLKAVTYQLE